MWPVPAGQLFAAGVASVVFLSRSVRFVPEGSVHEVAPA